MKKALEELVKLAIKEKPKNVIQLRRIKGEIAKKDGTGMATNAEILKAYRSLVKKGEIKEDEQLFRMLRKRDVRTLSGVAVISVLTREHPCPGKCVYCPTEKDMPKSYLSNEPAVMRAVLCEFDPYKQVEMRLRALYDNGHPTDKCELIVMGGTWSCLPPEYQEDFIKRCYDGYNKKESKDLEEAKKLNETAEHRVVGLTLETRPDYVDEKEVQRMLDFGATRVELGVQTVYDDILDLNQRGHRVEQTIQATKLLKDAGFKITYHMMPNLPGSDLDKDHKMFRELFTNPDFKPDQIKIYPCVVTKGSELYKWYKEGKYKPYTTEELVGLLKKVKKEMPEYVRIARLIRDIPQESIVAGSTVSNLRQLLQDGGVECKCIRCREPREAKVDLSEAKLVKRGYVASGGKEIFLTYESSDEKYLFAFCRLRLGEKAFIRELHTYGQMLELAKGEKAVQHFGFGKKLLAEAEALTKKAGHDNLWVISGVGVRDYYRKLGYNLEDNYMVKNI
ncbi:tRNA uridine(34) 5-carboxymethylaminomethyl modification radical SAM/GNAT enzyme Elp3 [Patescibacteria group bacterium]|nr:tRNA uridine(34) 5-carboxymethylaminomethyl modification radical SAM/GNAT enzyme Elp3 [Patescibacteria group bacterium]MBU1673971.1 tRNA uridine(34) 5-carboxymethylaminomethyl modification radical SAM/GNAT enzyme Elp3 [Patescibacteria group bacterium]MBU1962955.1 tRNA uridine(34) 5-carboxymethylaminomethyl modification radical SAM/GNAT enzyme Elp3 [Patescibacteria group bacterium]